MSARNQPGLTITENFGCWSRGFSWVDLCCNCNAVTSKLCRNYLRARTDERSDSQITCWKVLVGSFLSWWFRQKPFWLQGHFIGTSKWFERKTVVTDAARDRGSQTWNWKWKTISCFNWKVSTHHLALWNIVSGTKFSQPWIKVSLTSCLNNLIIKCQGFKISWTIFTFQLEQTAFTQSINLTFTSLLIYTHSKSTFWF